MSRLWYAQDQLAEEIASGHDAMCLGGVGELLDALAELRRGGVVDHLVGAELLRLLELPVAARRGDDARADALRDQKPEAPHAAAHRLHQNVLPGLELHALDKTVPGGV